MGTEDIQNKEVEADRDYTYLILAKAGAMHALYRKRLSNKNIW